MAAIESLTADAIIAMVNQGTWPPTFTLSAGNLINIGDVLSVDVSKASNVTFHVKNNGSAADTTGVTVFEGSIDSTTGTDGSWFAIQATRTDSNTIENGRAASSLAAGAASTYGWEASVGALKWFRVRQTVAGSASSQMHWSIAPTSIGTEPVPSIQSHPVTISGTPAVSISGTPTVALSGTPAVTSTTTPGAGTAAAIAGTASTNAIALKAAAGQLLELSVFNPTAAVVYVKLYNKATAPAPATDSALLMDVIPVAINGRVGIEYGAAGKRFPSGIALAITANPSNTDATAVAAGVVASATYL
jgi:hypothetical protein